MLNSNGLVAGAADYQPFGHVNRLSTPDSSNLPYLDEDRETFTSFRQPAENSNVQGRARARFMFVDIHDGQDDVTVYRNDPVAPQEVTYQDPEMSQVITPWYSLPDDGMGVRISAGPEDSSGPNTSLGAAMESFEYQRYQTGAQPFWTPLRFAGHYYDAETDLFENWNRYYDPSVGRYLQPEPLLAMGPAVLPTYAYAMNNPVNVTDPSGKDPIISLQTYIGLYYGVGLGLLGGADVSLQFSPTVGPYIQVQNHPIQAQRGYDTTFGRIICYSGKDLSNRPPRRGSYPAVGLLGGRVPHDSFDAPGNLAGLYWNSLRAEPS
ncbi:RHS repeat-associated core domain-containing protein [Corallococcus sp. EGB]|uniref:RHS repeat-associated core domain-containing protein n=1 Tax=Corallococcus sp. EGB TaxID=1521117 RepID=UPI001CBB15FD|nr:RHS repeat-associated core domain-containing protein [Corallococcus sp. EGB]